MDLRGYAESLGLDADRFGAELERHMYETRVAQDVESADLSGVSGTPTFFINGQRRYGAFDMPTLTEAIRVARERAITGTAPDWAPDEVYPGKTSRTTPPKKSPPKIRTAEAAGAVPSR